MALVHLHGSDHFLQGEEAGVDLLALEPSLCVVVGHIDASFASSKINEAQLSHAGPFVAVLPRYLTIAI